MDTTSEINAANLEIIMQNIMSTYQYNDDEQAPTKTSSEIPLFAEGPVSSSSDPLG
jgi:hypothetical protein